jgi:hypothetical protein
MKRISDSGYIELAMAIIKKAAQDLKSDNLAERRSAHRFFKEKEGNILIDFFKLNREKVLQKRK